MRRRSTGAIASMGRHVLKTPARTPQANAFCERVIGTLRRECLDWLIPIHEGHLRLVLGEWMTHYNRGRPHASLGPGIPEPVPDADQVTCTGHRLPEHTEVIATPILDSMNIAWRAAPRDRLAGARGRICGAQVLAVCRSRWNRTSVSPVVFVHRSPRGTPRGHRSGKIQALLALGRDEAGSAARRQRARLGGRCGANAQHALSPTS